MLRTLFYIPNEEIAGLPIFGFGRARRVRYRPDHIADNQSDSAPLRDGLVGLRRHEASGHSAGEVPGMEYNELTTYGMSVFLQYANVRVAAGSQNAIVPNSFGKEVYRHNVIAQDGLSSRSSCSDQLGTALAWLV
jgi:hypothetical protein